MDAADNALSRSDGRDLSNSVGPGGDGFYGLGFAYQDEILGGGSVFDSNAPLEALLGSPPESCIPSIVSPALSVPWAEDEEMVLDTVLRAHDIADPDIASRISELLPTKTMAEIVSRLEVLGKRKTTDDEDKLMPRDKRARQSRPSADTISLDEMNETVAALLLEENLKVISDMRTNLIAGRTEDNIPEMAQFAGNIALTLRWLKTISPDKIPPLPVKINSSFLPSETAIELASLFNETSIDV